MTELAKLSTELVELMYTLEDRDEIRNVVIAIEAISKLRASRGDFDPALPEGVRK